MKRVRVFALALTLPAATAGLAQAQGERAAEIECSSEGRSASGNLFRYRIHGAGEQAEDGAVAFSEDPRIDVFLDGRQIIDSRPLVYESAGAGHVYYRLPESVHGLTVDLSPMGGSVSVRHTVNVDDTLVTERGACTQAPARPQQGYVCNVFNQTSTSGAPQRVFYTDVLNLDLVAGFCRSWMRELFRYPRNFRVDWVASLPARPEREMVCGTIQPREEAEFSMDTGRGVLRLVELSAEMRARREQPGLAAGLCHRPGARPHHRGRIAGLLRAVR